MVWLISFNEFAPLWWNQPSFVIIQLMYIIGALFTLNHAFANRKGWPMLWFVFFINGLMVELVSFFTPTVNNFWHSQTSIMFCGNRLPLYITLFYPCIYYTASVGAALMKIPANRYESLAIGVLTVLLNVPCDLIGTKFLHWSWHSTDPNLIERNYGVPWNSYSFHFILSSVIVVLYRFNFNNSSKQLSTLSFDITGTIFSIVFATPCAFLLFSILYHSLHDFCGIHSQIIFLLLFSISLSIIWSADSTYDDLPTLRRTNSKKIIFVIAYVVLHFFVYSITLIIDNPEDQISTGLHQPIGDCNVTEPVYTLLGKVLQRKKFVCLHERNNAYFDFHCTQDYSISNRETLSWYTICGTPLQNVSEFICIILGIDIVAFVVFRNIFYTRSNESKERKKV